MNQANRASAAYVLNLSLLATHQVDAAFWHEWDVFGVPGGIGGFVVFNLIAVGLLGLGLVHVARAHATARRFELLCAGAGILTVAIHAVFLAVDRVAFWTPVSLGLLAAIAVVSVAQLVLARR